MEGRKEHSESLLLQFLSSTCVYVHNTYIFICEGKLITEAILYCNNVIGNFFFLEG